MNGKQVKNSILQLAIQGKLVPQDPNDEPASVLLARIRKKKESLVKEGKLKKKDLNCEPVTDEEKPFEIPVSWEWVRFGDIFSHNNGKQLNRADTQGELHDYITTSNLYWDRFDLKDVRQMLFTEDELKRCTATKGDLLVCEGGDVGRSAIWNYDYDICIQNHIHRVRAYLPLCTRFFLFLLMFNKSTGRIGGKGIGIQGFSAKALHNTIVALPPLAEQHRIVAKIEELLPFVEEYDKAQIKLDNLNANLPEALKKSILQEAIQGKLVPQDPNDEPASILLQRISEEKARLVKEGKLKKKDIVDTVIYRGDDNKYYEKRDKEVNCIDEEIPFDIPNTWEWVRLNYLASVARGGSPRPIKDFITESSEGVNWIKIGDTEKGGKYINSCAEKIKPEGVQRSRMVYPGDFLLTNSMSFGRPYITNVKGCIHDGWLVISQYLQVYDNDFLYYLLSSPFAFAQFSDKTAGAVVQNLNKDKVAGSIFPLPPITEQIRIIQKIEEIFKILK